MSETINENIIGIDLGTRFSCASIWRNNALEIITDQFGNHSIPSVVSFYQSTKLVGYNALMLKDLDPKNTIYDIKRIIGKRMDDPSMNQVYNVISYDLIDDDSKYHNILVKLSKTKNYKKLIYRPEEICSYILIEIKRMAVNYLKTNVNKCVLTVPAYFNDSQRQATLDAAKIAGWDVIKIINEPTAAALAYGLGNKTWYDENSKKDYGNVLIYDLGAGTLDISLIKISDGEFRTLAINGNSNLGGEDIDYLLMNFVVNEFKKQYSISNIVITDLMKSKLKNNVELAKKILSTSKKAIVCIDDFYDNKKLYHILTRENLELVCNEIFTMCIKPISYLLDSINISKDDIDEILLVGGSTRIPKIQSLILDFFAGTKIKYLSYSFNPDEIVSAGASIYGYIMTHNEDPFSNNLVLIDVLPLSLGIETLQKNMTVIIPRNTTLPTKQTKFFSTDTDNQTSVNIKIFEGERKLTKNNFHVGTFELSGFEKSPKGVPIIKITFRVDINGILQISVHEKKSNIKNKVKISSTWGAKGRLSKAEIDKLILEAEKNDDYDMVCITKVGLIHKIKSICDAIILNLKDEKLDLSNCDKEKIKKDAITNLEWIKMDINKLQLDELKKRENRLSKNYAPLIILTKDSDINFKEYNEKNNLVSINNDEDIEDSNYEKIENQEINAGGSDINEYKKIITELNNNILNIINNPVSNLNQDDINELSDYISTVNLWLYTVNSVSTLDYIDKINEINSVTENILNKYVNTDLFRKDIDFSKKDELQLICNTLKKSIDDSFLSVNEDNMERILSLVNETLLWLENNPNESMEIYELKLKEITKECNEIYHTTTYIKDNVNEDIIEEDTMIPITENIDRLINALPDKLIRKNDVILKIDMDKLKIGMDEKY